MPYPWRVVVTDCPLSPVDSVVCTGDGNVHQAMSAAYSLREDLGPEVGLGIEYYSGQFGPRWLRYAYLLTEQQREMVAELDRRRMIKEAKARIAAIKPKKKTVRKEKVAPTPWGGLPDG